MYGIQMIVLQKFYHSWAEIGNIGIVDILE